MDYKKIKVEEIDLNLARKISKKISEANRQLPFKINENNELVVLVDKLNKAVKTKNMLIHNIILFVDTKIKGDKEMGTKFT